MLDNQLTKMTGYVIHSANISHHSNVSSVDIAFVDKTVNPPRMIFRQKALVEKEIRLHPPKIAHNPKSTKTTLLPVLPSLRPASTIATTI
jgi:hypothetical protein